jgi:hypothetical protein
VELRTALSKYFENKLIEGGLKIAKKSNTAR